MKRYLLLIALQFVGNAALSQSDDWETVASSECGFTMKMPSPVASSVEVKPSGATIRRFSSDFFSLYCLEFPEAFVKLKGGDQILTEWMQSFPQTFSVKIERTAPIRLGAHNGLEFFAVDAIQPEQPLYYTDGRAFMVGNRLIFALANQLGERETDRTEISRFLEPLTLR